MVGTSLRTPLVLPCLLLAAFAVRGIAWLRTTVLFDDGPLFLYMAEAISVGDWSAVLRHPYHPLYSGLTAALAPLLGGDFEQAGALVSVLSGTAAVGALFVFLRDAFDADTAFLGALLLAFHPFAVEFSSDVQSDGLYLALLLAGICLVWRAIEGESPRLAASAGFASALAYLVRPEGLGVTVIGGAAGVLLCMRGRWRLPQAAVWLAALALGTALAAGPYVVALRQETGVWSLTQKKSLGALLSWSADRSAAEAANARAAATTVALPVQKSLTLASRMSTWRELPVGDRLMPAYSELWKAAVSGIRVELIALCVLGIVRVRGAPGRRGWFIASFVGLYGLLLYALAMNAGYVSRRHALPPLVPLLGYAGLGAALVGEVLVKGFARLRGRPGDVRAVTAIATASLVIACMWLPRDLRSRRDERLAERLAAEWLREQDPSVVAVGAGRLRVAYYADAQFVPIPPLGSEGASAPLLGYLQELGARYVIVDEAVAARHAGLLEARAGGMRLVHREQARGYSAAVFQVPAAEP
jgi:4-amino-4-deoxy-L-arabinose transferase-like glycosyltransferase